MAYKELIRDYSYTVDETGRVSGSRKFVVDAGGPLVSLPVRGTSVMPDESGVNMAGVVARRIRVMRDPDDKDAQYVVEYDSQSREAPSPARGLTTDGNSRSFEGSVEVQSVDVKEEGWWRWRVSDQYMDAGLQLMKQIVLVNFTITRAGLSTANKDALFTIMRSLAGTINSSAFEGFAIGQVLFRGWRGGDYTEQDGTRKWTIEMNFTARLLTGELDFNDVAITQDDWLYIMRPDNNKWDQPWDASGNYLYRKTDFGTLL